MFSPFHDAITEFDCNKISHPSKINWKNSVIDLHFLCMVLVLVPRGVEYFARIFPPVCVLSILLQGPQAFWLEKFTLNEITVNWIVPNGNWLVRKFCMYHTALYFLISWRNKRESAHAITIPVITNSLFS